MEILVLGTSAAEGWPAPWCKCNHCTNARKLGGRNVRTRAGVLIDGTLKVDYGPDTHMQMLRENRDFTAVQSLVFTHAHDDHFVPAELQYHEPPFRADTELPALNIYGSDVVCDGLQQKLAKELDSPAMVLHPPLEPFVPVTTADGATLLPLPAVHAPGALLLRITRGGRAVFYGHDSGIFPAETIEALAGSPLDAALFDCTFGGQPSSYDGHMGIDGVIDMADRLRSVGAVTEKTQLIATHFSHNGGVLHDELVARFDPHHIHVAYDGMLIDL